MTLRIKLFSAFMLSASPLVAQTADHCKLAGNYIDLGNTTLTYVLNQDAVKRYANVDVADLFFDDDIEGAGEVTACEGGGMAGAIRCQVTSPIENQSGSASSNANPLEASTFAPETSPLQDEGARDLIGSDLTISVPVTRFYSPGPPAQVFTVPSGAPTLKSDTPITAAARQRLKDAIGRNYQTLARQGHPVSQISMDQMMNGGTSLPITVAHQAKDDLLQTSPATPGVRLPSECVSLLRLQQEEAAAKSALQKKSRECNILKSNIKARERENSKGGLVDSLAGFFGQDERLTRLTNRHKACVKDAAVLRASYNELKKRAKARRDRLNSDQHEREIAAIKADPKRLKEEKKIRESRLIGARAQYEKQVAKIQDGMNAYNKNLLALDKQIADMKAGDDPDKEAKVAALERERQRYEATYDSWLARMISIKDVRERDFNRLLNENAKDGIGATSNKELRNALSARGLNPTEVISAEFGEGLDRAAIQAQRDRETLGGSTTTGQTGNELLAEVVEDYYTMSPAERARRLWTYGPDALKGIAEGTYEGGEGLFKLGKGLVDLIPEAAGFEGFEGSTVDKLVGTGSKLSDQFTRGTDGRANDRDVFENFSDNMGKYAGKLDDKFNRGFETLAGSGEKGIKEGVKKFAKGGTMIAGGEVAALQTLSKFNQGLKALRGLDAAGDVARGADVVADLSRAGDAATDLARAGDGLNDATRTVDRLNDATRTTDGLNDATRTTDGLNDATRTVENLGETGGTFGKTRTTPPGEVVDPNKFRPIDAGPVRKFPEKSPARATQDALERAGVDPSFARVYGARATERSADAAIAGGAFEAGVSPKTLLRNGSTTEEGLRKGIKSYLNERGVPPAEQGGIIEKFMNRPSPDLPSPTPAAAKAADIPNPATAATKKLSPAEGAGLKAPTVRQPAPATPIGRDPLSRNAGRFSKEELARRLGEKTAEANAATKRLSPADGAGLKSPTVRQPGPVTNAESAATAATKKLSPAEGAGLKSPTVRQPGPVTNAESAATAATKKLSPAEGAGLKSPTIRQPGPVTNAESAATAATKKLSPAEGAGLKAPTVRQPGPVTNAESAATAATKKLSPAEGAGLKSPTVRQPAPVAALDPPTKRLPAPVGPNPSTITPSPIRGPAVDPVPVVARPTPDGGVHLSHNGREITLPKRQEIGIGQTSRVYGSDEGINVVKLSKEDQIARHLDELGRSAMEGKVAIPEVRGRYKLSDQSRLHSTDVTPGGTMTVLEKGPPIFAKAAEALRAAGKGIGAERKAALQSFAKRMNDEGFVVSDLKADNFGFRPSDKMGVDKALDLVPLDDGILIKLKAEFAHRAPEMQKIIIDPGDLARSFPEGLALNDIRERLSLFDHMVDWKAMNGGRANGPLSTLGRGAGNALPYTPTLGLHFKGLAN